MEYDIFISYSRSDHAIVDTFVQRLESAGYKVWIDRTGVYSGSQFKSMIVQAIEDSMVFLFFSSKDSNSSPWTAKEIGIAVNRQKPIIPIKLDDTPYNRSVEFDLIDLDFVGYKNKSSREQECNKLMRTLENILGKKQPLPMSKEEKKDLIKFDFLKNNRGCTISIAFISLLLIVAVPLFYSTSDFIFSSNVRDFKHCKRVAEQGYSDDQYQLGLYYEEGKVVTRDYQEAVKWYRKAAEQGHARAQCQLGVCYYVGNGVTQDYQEALKWFRKASEQGEAVAQNNLGLCYEKGLGVTQDYQEAAKWYRKSADQDFDKAQYKLGLLYEEGKGVTQNYQEAVECYRKAAEQGHIKAQCSLGVCYEKGNGITKNYQEAVKWYRKAADQGNAYAQYNLGCCYENGHGVPKDYQKALKWYRLAAHHGIEDACKAIERLTP